MPGEPILIVDDNPHNLKLARVLLVGEGYDARTAVDAEQALTLLETFMPRLILMDIQLPGMDGLELTRRLKAEPADAGHRHRRAHGLRDEGRRGARARRGLRRLHRQADRHQHAAADGGASYLARESRRWSDATARRTILSSRTTPLRSSCFD